MLPPSEGKATTARSGRPADPAAWSFPELATTRGRVAAAAATAAGQDDALAIFGVSEVLREDVLANLDLATAPARRAGHLYTGVLFDALGYTDLDPAARRRAHRWVLVFSALHGVVRLTDRIPAYRLSIGTTLPGLGALDRMWREVLSPVLTEAAGSGLIVDARSAAYAAMWRPGPELANQWVRIAVPGASHMAKHTRGLVIRHLLQAAVAPRTPPALAAAVEESFAVTLDRPRGMERPWVLSVNSARAATA